MLNNIIKYKSILKSLISVLSVDVFVKASGLLLLPIYLKLMLPEEYGLYSYIIGLSSFLSSVGSMGMYGALNRYFYDKSYSKCEVVSTLVILLSFFITSTIVFSFILYNLGGDVLFSQKLPIIIVAIGIFASFHTVFIQFVTAYFYINKKYKEVQLYNISRLILVNGISISVLYTTNDNAILERLISLIFSELLILAYFTKYLKQYLHISSFNKKLAILSVKFGYPLAISAILGFVYSFADKYFIQSNFGFASVGEYTFIFTFASLFGIIFSAIQNFWLPFFFAHESRSDVEKKLIYLIFCLFAINVAFYFSIMFIMGILFKYEVFDASYKHGLNYLNLLVLAQLFNSIQALYNNYYALHNKTLNGLYITVIMSIVSLLVMYYFVSKYEVLGVAISVLVSSIIRLVLTIFVVNRFKRNDL